MVNGSHQFILNTLSLFCELYFVYRDVLTCIYNPLRKGVWEFEYLEYSEIRIQVYS